MIRLMFFISTFFLSTTTVTLTLSFLLNEPCALWRAVPV
jgi:hypothetical protein